MFLIEKLKTQAWEAEEAKKKVETLKDEFDGVNHDAFCKFVQQILQLNPGVMLKSKGLSVDHVVNNGVLTNIRDPRDLLPFNLEDLDLKVFDPYAPFVREDSEATESDDRDGDRPTEKDDQNVGQEVDSGHKDVVNVGDQDKSGIP
jgi:hypothetical protein